MATGFAKKALAVLLCKTKKTHIVNFFGYKGVSYARTLVRRFFVVQRYNIFCRCPADGTIFILIMSDFNVTTPELLRVNGRLDNGFKSMPDTTTPPADGVKFQISAPKIDLRAMPSPIPKALFFGDTALVAKGELITLVALPSSGKSNICEALVAAYAAAKGYTPLDTLGFSVPKATTSLQKKLLWIDTERTTNDVLFGVQRLLNRVNAPADKLEEILDIYSFAEMVNTDNLHKELAGILDTNNYDFCIIDGVLDFCSNFLDSVQSTNAVKFLRALAIKHDLPIITTMHPNKGTEIMAGHLGAMLYRYSRACLFIRYDPKSGTRQITSDFIQRKLSHSDTPVNGYFSWDTDSGMMRTCEGSPIAPPAILYDLDKVKKVFGNTPEMASKDFKTQYGLLVGISDSTASRHITKLLADGIITSTGNSKATRYRLLADDENLPF